MRNRTDMVFFARTLVALFARDERGATAIVFSLAIIPLMLFVGLGIDVARLEKRRHDNQIFLDAALISALARDGRDVSAGTVQTFYNANGGFGDIGRFNVESNSGTISASVAVSSAMPMLFGGFASLTDSVITVAAEAKSPLRLTDLRIIPERASGWFIKTLKLYVTREGDPTPILLGTIKYAPSTPRSVTGTMTSDFGDDYVSIEDAESIWFEMIIDPSSEGIEDPNLKLDLRTNDPETASNLFVDGQQMSKGRIVNLAEIASCGEQSHHAWEDGGNFAVQDFFYTVTGRCNTGGSGVAYVSK